MQLTTIPLIVHAALKHLPQLPFGQAFSVVPNLCSAVLVGSPAQPLFVLPGSLQGGLFSISEEMARFMQQHRGAFTVVNRNLKKFSVDSNDLKRKIGGGERVPMAEIAVKPIVRDAEYRQMSQDRSFATKTFLLNQSDGRIDFVALVRVQPRRAYQQRKIE